VGCLRADNRHSLGRKALFFRGETHEVQIDQRNHHTDRFASANLEEAINVVSISDGRHDVSRIGKATGRSQTVG
jgi:hypothetical protein